MSRCKLRDKRREYTACALCVHSIVVAALSLVLLARSGRLVFGVQRENFGDRSASGAAYLTRESVRGVPRRAGQRPSQRSLRRYAAPSQPGSRALPTSAPAEWSAPAPSFDSSRSLAATCKPGGVVARAVRVLMQRLAAHLAHSFALGLVPGGVWVLLRESNWRCNSQTY